jgi:hypothetical protein
MKLTSSQVLRRYDGLFDSTADDVSFVWSPCLRNQLNMSRASEDAFTLQVVSDLVDRLDGNVAIPLNHFEKSLLATIAQATLEIERQRRALDVNGLRYLISIRLLANQDRRTGLSGTATPASGLRTPSSGASSRSSRLSFRNIVWATHSESQDILLQAATECCRDGKMVWSDAKHLGIFLWLSSTETIVSNAFLPILQLRGAGRNRN